MTVVIDASAIGALLLPDEDEDLGRLASEVCQSEQLHVPAIFRSEVANLLRKAHRHGRIGEARLRSAAAEADVVAAIAHIGVDPPIAEIVSGSTVHGLSGYDFTYFALARSLGVPLLTGDGALRRAAIAAGMDVRLP